MEKGIVMEEMQTVYDDEVESGYAATGLRGLIDFFTDESLSENLPMLLRAMEGTNISSQRRQRLRDISRPIDTEGLASEISEAPRIFALLEELGTAGQIGELAMGAMSPGAKFKGFREGLEAIKDRLLSREKNPDKSELDLLRESGASQSVLSRMRSPSFYYSPRDVVEGQTERLAKELEAFDLGLTDEIPTEALQTLYSMAARRGVNIDDLVQELRQNAIPTRPRSKYSDTYENPILSDVITQYPDRTKTATRRQRSRLVDLELEDRARRERGLPVRDTAETRRYRRQGDQIEMDFSDR